MIIFNVIIACCLFAKSLAIIKNSCMLCLSVNELKWPNDFVDNQGKTCLTLMIDLITFKKYDDVCLKLKKNTKKDVVVKENR